MKISHEAKDLIKRYEGLRLKAYKCAAGVWTIGYGHTSAAGSPVVTPSLSITKEQADEIFEKDITTFANGVASLIKVDLNPHQFGACVSLAYNIGLGAFSKSSVLRFINKKQYDNAADAFLLWNKAGGKVLKGLTRRRSEESELFSTREDGEDRIPDAPKGKPMVRSSTNIAASVTAVAGLSAAAKEVVDNTSSMFSSGTAVAVLLGIVIIAGAAWIIKERWQLAKDWAV